MIFELILSEMINIFSMYRTNIIENYDQNFHYFQVRLSMFNETNWDLILQALSSENQTYIVRILDNLNLNVLVT